MKDTVPDMNFTPILVTAAAGCAGFLVTRAAAYLWAATAYQRAPSGQIFHEGRPVVSAASLAWEVTC